MDIKKVPAVGASSGSSPERDIGGLKNGKNISGYIPLHTRVCEEDK